MARNNSMMLSAVLILKIHRPQGCASSTLAPSTTKLKGIPDASGTPFLLYPPFFLKITFPNFGNLRNGSPRPGSTMGQPSGGAGATRRDPFPSPQTRSESSTGRQRPE